MFTTHSPQEDRGSFETRSTLREMFSWRIGRCRFSMNSRIYSRQKLFVCRHPFDELRAVSAVERLPDRQKSPFSVTSVPPW